MTGHRPDTRGRRPRLWHTLHTQQVLEKCGKRLNLKTDFLIHKEPM